MDNFKRAYDKILLGIPDSLYLSQLESVKSASSNRPVILYGAGKAVGIVLLVCRKFGLDIDLLCDSNRSGIYENGGVSLPIITPQQLVGDYSDSSLIVTSWKFESEIRKNLESIGFNSNNIFSFWYPQRVTPDIFENNYFDGYKWAYDFYEDEKSKQLVLDKINSYLSSCPLNPNTMAEMYYEDVMAFDENEVILDGGAYDGDSIKFFTQKSKGEYKNIYAFEPDNRPFEKLQRYANGLQNIKLFNAGLGARDETQKFYYDGLVASGFVPLEYFATTGDKFSDAEFKIENKKILSIDSMVNDGEIIYMPTFIKLDVEGDEVNVLIGAKNLIQENKPKLAICAYHQVQDIYEVPKTILNIRNDYKFILRQHDYGYYETILYAY